jgi:hypothetical protein
MTDATPVERLIERLGDDDFEVREQATEQLSVRDDAWPAVRGVLQSPDAEVRRRAASILEALEARRKRRLIQGTAALARDGAVDEFLERLVRWGDADKEDVGGQAAVQLIDKLLELERPERERQMWSPIMSPLGSYADYLKDVKPTILASPLVREDKQGTYLVRCEDMAFTWGPGAGSLIFCSGPARIPALGHAVILAGGSVETGHGFIGVVVVCDGDCRMGGERQITDYSLIIARGDVYCPWGIHNCTIIAGGKVHFREERQKGWNIVRENEPNAFGFVHFFDPARIGLVTDPDARDARLKEVRPQTPFAAAGLRAGDVVLTVGGKPTPDRETFRRMLRRALAEGEVSFTVRRDGRTLELTAWPKD